MNYSKIIKKIRKKMIFSQSELALYLNVSFATVNRWENGKFNPTTKSKRKVITLYNKLFKENL